MTPTDPTTITEFLKKADACPVLVDVGASGADHPLWGALAAASHFIGFDPDTRDLNPDLGKAFAKHDVVNKIVGGPKASSDTPFYLTALPACSSMLKPNTDTLQHYLFADLFKVEKELSFDAITLSGAMESLGINEIDWLKLDTQGCDWTVLQGLDQARFDSILCLEIEPGFAQFYEGEETFVELHAELTAAGFWLASLDVQAFPRVRGDVIEKAFGGRISAIDPVAGLFGGSPTAAEALYFRTLDHLGTHAQTLQRYAIAWAFAVCIGKFGVALDLAFDAQARFGESETTTFMRDAAKSTVAALSQQNSRS